MENLTSKPVFFFLLGCLISVAGTYFVIYGIRNRLGMDKPDAYRKHHKTPVSRLGGLPIFAAFLAATAWLASGSPKFMESWWPVLLTSALMFGIGFLDDLKPLGAKFKLLGQIGVAVLAFSIGLSINGFTNPIAGGKIDLAPWLSFLITVGWLVAIPNIINLIDGMDGLASGLCLFICLTIGVVGVLAGNKMDVAFMALALSGALLGFLFFNFPPARIFLGDGGAYFIGYFIAAISIHGSNKGATAAALMVVMVALGLPILDTAFAILRRGIRGVPLFRADADHIHHRLLLLGFSKDTAVLVLYGVCITFSLIGLSLFWRQGMMLPVAGAAVVIVALVGARYLGYIENFRLVRQQLRKALQNRRDIQYATLLGEVLEFELERCQSADEFWGLFRQSLGRLHLYESPEEVTRLGFKPVKLEVRPHHERPWNLYYPEDAPITRNWKGVAECLQPAYAIALGRWGGEPAPGLPAGSSTPDPERKSSPLPSNPAAEEEPTPA